MSVYTRDPTLQVRVQEGAIFHVYPSAIQVINTDGTGIWLDVGWLYPLMAAHLAQNGQWGSLDYDALPDSTKAMFENFVRYSDRRRRVRVFTEFA